LENDLQDLDNFINIDKIYCIFHIRDPRDVLVSSYYSAGWIHGDFDTGEHAKLRKKVQSIDIDQYVLSHKTKEIKAWYDKIMQVYSMN